MEGLLTSIFEGFRWIWEAKLGGKSFQNHSKIHQNSNQNSIQILTSRLEASKVIFIGRAEAPDVAPAVLGGS